MGEAECNSEIEAIAGENLERLALRPAEVTRYTDDSKQTSLLTLGLNRAARDVIMVPGYAKNILATDSH